MFQFITSESDRNLIRAIEVLLARRHAAFGFDYVNQGGSKVQLLPRSLTFSGSVSISGCRSDISLQIWTKICASKGRSFCLPFEENVQLILIISSSLVPEDFGEIRRLMDRVGENLITRDGSPIRRLRIRRTKIYFDGRKMMMDIVFFPHSWLVFNTSRRL